MMTSGTEKIQRYRQAFLGSMIGGDGESATGAFDHGLVGRPLVCLGVTGVCAASAGNYFWFFETNPESFEQLPAAA